MKRIICLSCGNHSDPVSNRQPCLNCDEVNWCQQQDIVETFEGKLGMVSEINSNNDITLQIPFMGTKVVQFTDVREKLGRAY